MRRSNRHESQKLPSEPNPFDYLPKNVWREVYNGRWAELAKVQRVEFIVEVVCFVLLVGGLAYGAYVAGNLLGWIFGFGAVGLVLLGFFLLLTRYIR